MDSELLTTTEVAKICKKSNALFEKFRCNGGGSTFIRCGRSILYRSSDLESCLKDREFNSTSEAR